MRRIGLAVVLVATFAFAPVAGTVERIYRLGVLMSNRSLAFEQELKRLGYVEGQNILIMRRYFHVGLDNDGLVRELVEFRPNVIAVSNGEMARAVRRASKTIPIVVAASGDLVAQGLAANLAKPGGNVTGLQTMSTELASKRLEILREFVPTRARLAVLVPWRGDSTQQRETELAAHVMGMRVEILRVPEMNSLVSAFNTLKRSRYDGLVVFSNSFTFDQRAAIVVTAAGNHLPSMYEGQAFVAAGGLVSYAPNMPALYQRAATFVDKILKGAKPADLPIEQPTKFELVINLKTAKALGLTIPQTLLLRADQVIE
jgi:putative tryptophan/tyrosine transport system substrate-binding protein